MAKRGVNETPCAKNTWQKCLKIDDLTIMHEKIHNGLILVLKIARSSAKTFGGKFWGRWCECGITRNPVFCAWSQRNRTWDNWREYQTCRSNAIVGEWSVFGEDSKKNWQEESQNPVIRVSVWSWESIRISPFCPLTLVLSGERFS